MHKGMSKDNIFPLIADAKTTKESWDNLERSFGVGGVFKLKMKVNL